MTKQLIGVVVGRIDSRTIKVKVTRTLTHRLYKKQLHRSKNYLVDGTEDVLPGDRVTIVQTAPISANKHFRLKAKTSPSSLKRNRK